MYRMDIGLENSVNDRYCLRQYLIGLRAENKNEINLGF
jgi:hypothetical protein